MIQWDTLKETLHDWAMDQSGYDTDHVLWVGEDTSSLTTPYLTLQISSLVKIKEDYTGPPDDDGLAIVYGDREFILAVKAYQGDPMLLLENMANSLNKFEVRLELPEELAFIESQGITDVSEDPGTGFEERALAKLRFRVSSQFQADGTTSKPYTTDEVGVIEEVTVEGQGTYEHPGGNEVGD